MKAVSFAFHVKVHKVHESLRPNAAPIDELALQYGGIGEKMFNARFQTAVNLSVC